MRGNQVGMDVRVRGAPTERRTPYIVGQPLGAFDADGSTMEATGIRAEVAIRSPGGCPVAAVSAETGATSRTISRGVGASEVTEEFLLDSGVDVGREDVERVFSYGEQDVYRFTRERGSGCPCEAIERHGCPVVDVTTRDGTLYLVFHAPTWTGSRPSSTT